MRFFVAVFCLLAVTACDLWSPTEPAPVNAELTLAPGQTSSVADTDLAITFEEVAGDNRCPGDALCIQGGSATVRIQVKGPGSASSRYNLETGTMAPVRHREYKVELLELSPYPFSSRPFDPSEYRVRLRITR